MTRQKTPPFTQHGRSPSTPPLSSPAARGQGIQIWDLFVRLFHWSLVVAISLALLSGFVLGRAWVQLHVWSSTAAVVLVVLRLVWGLFGPGPARFSGFVTLSPARLKAYVLALRSGTGRRHLGHNPLGGLMIVALIATVLGLGLSGVATLGGVLKLGPLAGWVSYGIGSVWRELHELFGLGLLLLIAGHLGGVVLESWRHRENLAVAMVSGRKELRPGDLLPARKRARPLLAAVLGAVLIGGGAWVLTALSQRPPQGLPVQEAQFDPAFAEECAACHMLYNPSMLPAQDWQNLMQGLDNHFGEDASLDPDTTARITDWLVAHAAETADTRAAHLFRLGSTAGDGGSGQLVSITRGRAWKHLHDDALESGIFDLKSVRSPANCQACHKDAQSGLFSPYAIKVPKE